MTVRGGGSKNRVRDKGTSREKDMRRVGLTERKETERKRYLKRRHWQGFG